MYCFTNTSIHTAFSSTASAIRCHSALLADSSQLIAFIFLPLFLITVIDPSHSFRMTSFVLHHYDASRSPLLVTSFPPIVILNGGKHAV